MWLFIVKYYRWTQSVTRVLLFFLFLSALLREKKIERIAYKRWFIIFYSYYIFKKRPKMLMVWLVPIHCSLVRMPELFNSVQILDKIWIAEKTVIRCTGPLNTYTDYWMVHLGGIYKTESQNFLDPVLAKPES